MAYLENPRTMTGSDQMTRTLSQFVQTRSLNLCSAMLLSTTVALSGCIAGNRQALPESQRDLSGKFNGTYSLSQLAAKTRQTIGSHVFNCPDIEEERSYMMFVREGQAVVQGRDVEERAIQVSLLGNFYGEFPLQAAFGSFSLLTENDDANDRNDSESNETIPVESRKASRYSLIIQGRLSTPYRGGITWAVEELNDRGCTASLKIERL